MRSASVHALLWENHIWWDVPFTPGRSPSKIFFPQHWKRFFLNYCVLTSFPSKVRLQSLLVFVKKKTNCSKKSGPTSPLSRDHCGRQAVRPVVFFKEPCWRGSHAQQMEIHCKHDPFAAMHSKFPFLKIVSAWSPFFRTAKRITSRVCLWHSRVEKSRIYSESHYTLNLKVKNMIV